MQPLHFGSRTTHQCLVLVRCKKRVSVNHEFSGQELTLGSEPLFCLGNSFLEVPILFAGKSTNLVQTR